MKDCFEYMAQKQIKPYKFMKANYGEYIEYDNSKYKICGIGYEGPHKNKKTFKLKDIKPVNIWYTLSKKRIKLD